MQLQLNYNLAAVEAITRSKQPPNPDPFSVHLLPWQETPYHDQSPILLLTGSAGGGKSRLAGQMMHRDMQRYHGAMGLILRKTRESMNNSTVLFYERMIVGKTPHVHHNRGQHRFEYEDSGSIVAYGGMKDEDQREQIRSIGQSGGVDRVWMEEATRFTEADLNEILARMRGTASDYCQIILTTNPDSPTHFIKTRLIDGGQASVYFSSAVDNAHNPPEYIQTLQQLTGIQALRLGQGKWVQAMGVVFDNWDIDNITSEAEYNPNLPVHYYVDDGYALGKGTGTESYHPRVILFAQETAIGGVNIFDEYYAVQELSEVSLRNALERPDPEHPYARPEAAYCDSSAAELRGRIWNEGIMTVAATHPVHEGIKNMRRMVCDGNGVRLLRSHPRCVEFNREIASYRYNENTNAAVGGEPVPMKIDDHGVSACRYGLWHLRYD